MQTLVFSGKIVLECLFGIVSCAVMLAAHELSFPAVMGLVILCEFILILPFSKMESPCTDMAAHGLGSDGSMFQFCVLTSNT